mmetsp:Transcript_13591/g.39320  ORF Transcript_13591/g.39320 Transcript_13591/m.39320 type:complete len:221 (-) Transcript_13591:679-1341(-)
MPRHQSSKHDQADVTGFQLVLHPPVEQVEVQGPISRAELQALEQIALLHFHEVEGIDHVVSRRLGQDQHLPHDFLHPVLPRDHIKHVRCFQLAVLCVADHRTRQRVKAEKVSHRPVRILNDVTRDHPLLVHQPMPHILFCELWRQFESLQIGPEQQRHRSHVPLLHLAESRHCRLRRQLIQLDRLRHRPSRVLCAETYGNQLLGVQRPMPVLALGDRLGQ